MKRAPLLPAAVTAWGAAAAGVAWPAAAGWLAAALWCGTLVLLAASLRFRGPGALVVALALAAVVVSHVAFAQPARAAALDFGVSGGRAVTVTAIVSSKVDRSGDAVRFDAEAIEIAAGDTTEPLRVPVVVRVDPSQVDRAASLDLGATVMARGTAMPASSGRAVLVVFASRGVEVIAAPSGLLAAASGLRAGLIAQAATFPQPGAGLLPGLAVGDTRAVGEDLAAAMKTASLTHLTAVSGANCAIVVGLGFGAAALLRARRWVRVAVAMAALGGFVVLVTPEPSVVRAAAMATVAMLGLLLGRRMAGFAALCLAVTVVLATDPWLAVSLGFALSVAATAALLLLAPPLAAGLAGRMPRPLALALSVPLAAQLACGPLLVAVSPVVPLYGVPANLVAAPAVPIATIAGLAACITTAVPWLSAMLTAIAWLPSAWIAATALTVSALPAASVPWIDGLLGCAALAVVGACVAIVVSRGHPRRAVARGIALVAVAGTVGAIGGTALLAGPVAAVSAPRDWSIAVCDIGQGDAILVRSDEAVALIDTGPEPEPLAACLNRLGIARVALLVLTHFDLDHVGGASAIAGRVDVVLHGPSASAADEALLRDLGRRGAQVREAHQGMHGSLGRARWRVLWPRGGTGGVTGNDASVVLDVRGGGVPASLFLGDLSASPQRMLAAGAVLQPPYAVVKVAHHGSADQDAGLYRTAHASLALISVGADNDYGHPRDEILDELAADGAVVARTDLEGLVVVSSSDSGVSLWRQRSPP